MTVVHLDGFQRWARRHLVCHADAAGRRFALTFDDGPSRRNTPALLDALAAHGSRATFFVLRGRVRSEPTLARRILSEGHEIGIHGDTHWPAWTMPSSWIAREITRSQSVLRELLGMAPRHYRAPFGLLWPAQAAMVRAHGLVPVLGDVYPRDSTVRSAERITGRVLARLASGCIVILHDSSVLGDPDRGPTVAAVERILVAASGRGLRSVTLAELLAPRDPDHADRAP